MLLVLTMKWAQEERTPLASVLSRITCAPAGVAGVPGGRLDVGAPADLCLFDASDDWMVKPDSLVSEGHNTPFVGFELPAPVRMTLVGGKVVFDRSKRGL